MDSQDYEIVHALRRILRSVNAHSRRLARESGLSVPQVLALRAVADLEAATPASVARFIQLTPSTTTGVIDRLESEGLIERQRSDRDRRSVRLVLTDAGRERVDLLPPPVDARFVVRFSRLDADTQRRVLDGLALAAQLMDGTDAEVAAATGAEASSTSE